jgi:hypothetical protein
MGRKKMGEFLIELGVLTEQEVDTILKHSKTTGLRFTEAAVNLGLLKTNAPLRLVGSGISVDFFHLNPEYFPRGTKDIIPLDAILKYGVLPLGLKNKRGIFKSSIQLNLGFLNPKHKENVGRELETLAAKGNQSIHATKCYLVLVDEFLHVLDKVYGLNSEKLRAISKDSRDLDETLKMFLENSEGDSHSYTVSQT